MIDAVLFDLDGTLLENDMQRFMRHYLRALASRLAHLIPPAQFAEQLMTATDRMIENPHPNETNQQAFWREFEQVTGLSEKELSPILDDFYTNEFSALRVCTRSRPEARPLVETVINLGRQAVLATNPLFPMKAIRHRMEWAGIDDLPFALITSYEHFHSCKPYPAYFQEVAERIGVAPARCLMVGDDMKMDGPARDAGMQLFWVIQEEPFTRERGSLTHLHALLLDGLLDK